MEKIQFYLDHRSYEQILLGAVVFSNVYGLLGQTRDAEELIHKIQEQAVGVNVFHDRKPQSGWNFFSFRTKFEYK